MTRRTLWMLVGLIIVGLTGAGGTLAQSSGRQERESLPRAVELQLIAEGFTSPVAMAESPDGTGRRFVVDQTGQIWIITPRGERLATPFLDLRDRLVELNPRYDERGLLGLAFHPRYGATGRFFVYYSAPLRAEAPDDYNHTAYLAEFRVAADDPKSGAGAECTLHPDAPAVELNQLAHNCQAEATAAARRTQLLEWGENGLVGLRRDAGPVVVDRELYFRREQLAGHHDPRSDWRVLIGVAEQIDQHPLQESLVADDRQGDRQVVHDHLTLVLDQCLDGRDGADSDLP